MKVKYLSFDRRVITGFSASLFIVILVGLLSWLSLEKEEENDEWVKHTYQVIGEIGDLSELFINAQSGYRGYVISRNESFLDPYNLSVSRIDSKIIKLKKLIIENPVQQERLARLGPLKKLLLDEWKKNIELTREGRTDEAVALITSGEGKRRMDRIRTLLNEMRKDERDLMMMREKVARQSSTQTELVIIIGSLLVALIVIIMILYITKTFRKQREAEAAIQKTYNDLEILSEENKKRNWLLSGSGKINDALRGEIEITELANNVINEIAQYLGAKVGALYIFDENNKTLTLTGTYAYQRRKSNSNIIHLGEGLIGQCALEKKPIVFTDIPQDYIKISSGLGEIAPKTIALIPFIFNNKLKGVIELGAQSEFSDVEIELLNLVSEDIAIALAATQARVSMRELYEKTQQQAEELISQQEELRQTNNELTKQTQRLQASEEELRVQQEELQQANAELEQKAQLLEEKNEAIEQARQAIAIKAEEIESTSKYKSEFLANMSHELRTPLNSMLILAKLLSENKTSNLNEKQIEYAKVIHKSGNDLLTLINDILDLSKIEAGKIDLAMSDVELSEIQNDITSLFKETANDKKISFEVKVEKNVSKKIHTDKVRLEQVLRNLLSNAFKFTPQNGKVSLNIYTVDKTTLFKNESLYKAPEVIAFEVKDSGIGIAKDKQKIVFEAFQQADGSTSRKYGGTGLGLSISRELAILLGGEIRLESEENKGSTFTIYVPVKQLEKNIERTRSEITSVFAAESKTQPVTVTEDISTKKYNLNELPDDRNNINPDDRTILIVEDDLNFANILKDFAHERNYKTIIAVQGDKGLEYAARYKPNAIILDMQLPVLDGWSILKALKNDTKLKNIPVHIMSAMDKEKLGLQMGAITYLKKPIDTDTLGNAFDHIEKAIRSEVKNILIIEDDKAQSNSISQLIKSNEQFANCDIALSGGEAIKKLNEKKYDCIILDLALEDISGNDLLENIKNDKKFSNIPVIIYTGKDLTEEEEKKLKKLSSSIILKTSRSYERLLDETSLFLHKIDKTNGSTKEETTKRSVHLEEILKNKNVLLVDDDMRNVFALSTVLEEQGMNVITASDGREAIQKLETHSETDIILMDIMMPEMDGYEAMRTIRKKDKYRNLPILALTAKAMQGDREKCMEAGASDYISKPVNIDQLFSLMRVWLYK